MRRLLRTENFDKLFLKEFEKVLQNIYYIYIYIYFFGLKTSN